MNFKTTLALGLAGLMGAQEVVAQAHTKEDYIEATWMTTRFYGAQRIGATYPNWMLLNHPKADMRTSFVKDADGSIDLTGGWNDCGDHATFGQTFFYSAYMLAKAYKEFTPGFHDIYQTDYSDYVAAGSFAYTTGSTLNGKSNGNPDILDELLAAAEFIVKATPNGSTFYFQKGDGEEAHKLWVSAGYQSYKTNSEGGEKEGSREMFKNPNDASMASFAAATLAILHKAYKVSNPSQAEIYKTHAINAWTYALSKQNSSGVSNSGGKYTYGANANMKDDLITAALELSDAFGDASYKTNVDGWTSNLKSKLWGFDYENNDPLAFYNLAKINADDTYKEKLKDEIDHYETTLSSEGITMSGNVSWGSMRYVGNVAYLMALYNKLDATKPYKTKLYKYVDFLLGANTSKQPFVIGFCKASAGCDPAKMPKHPHHRNAYLDDRNLPDDGTPNKQSITIHPKNVYMGALSGGGNGRTSGIMNDNVLTHTSSEVCIDYNAGLVGALGAIVAEQYPYTAGITIPLPSSAAPRVQHTASFSLARSAGTYEFSHSAGKPFTVDVYDLRGNKVASLRSAGESLRFAPAAAGVFHAQVRGANSSASYKLTGI